MARNDKKIKENGTVSEETLRELSELQRIGNRAVRRAQEENRKLGIPNWYSIGGKIVSDQMLSDHDRNIFLEILENPPKPNENLKEAVKEHRRRVKK